ncbi:MAG: methionine--tRNA ligase [Planctomycetes bacterium]|nr:methionine--tRNA ligase [Planctomycetota bacterium]MBI3847564.1 methionine--tRNA ligase [Planctomycetota bacterium]
MTERYLVTSALPYANGAIHFGHIVGAYLPADIFVRYQRMVGSDVLFICGTDEHGVPITINAEKAGLTPQAFVDRNHELIKGIFEKIRISFDHFSRTTRKVHYDVSQEFFTVLLKQGFIAEGSEPQFYCPNDKRFLADRYVEGECPNCGASGARGDECPKCGSWLDPKTLKNPRCKLCGATPEARETVQWYLHLEKFQFELEQWIASKNERWKPNVLRFVRGLLAEGLHERSISRDLAWGVPIPLPNAEGKVLYVWFDAPIGYVSATKEWFASNGQPERWKDYWFETATNKPKLIHFIGKDNIPFHAIVFPAMLMGMKHAGIPYVLPENVPANEFFNLEGRKFNKSEGWDIDLEAFFARYSVDSLRYALAALSPETADSEFTWKGFQARNNSELADVVGNLASRVVSFCHAHFDGKVPAFGDPGAFGKQLLDERDKAPRLIGSWIQRFELRNALQEWLHLARLTNKYLEETQPWTKRKTDALASGTSLHVALRALRTLAITGAPFVPDGMQRLWFMLGQRGPVEKQPWDDAIVQIQPGTRLGPADVLFPKIDDAVIDEEIRLLHVRAAAKTSEVAARTQPGAPASARPRPAPDSTRHEHEEGARKPMESEQNPAVAAATAPPVSPAFAPIKEQIDYELFSKLDLRVGRILEAEVVPKSKNLLRLKVDIGIETRQVLAGISQCYAPASLIGRQVVVLANLQPRKLMGLESQGMVLAGHLGDAAVILVPEKEATVGGIVK